MSSGVDIVTIDVEEWFHGHNYLEHVPPEKWDDQQQRVVANTEQCLELLDRHGVRATFFVLGWTAERHPTLVQRIIAAGHEVGCHSYAHPVVFQQTEQQFLTDLDRALEALALAGATECRLYRAPSFSLTGPVHSYLPRLVERGIRCDCSLFPIHHPRYGQPNAPRRPFLLTTEVNGTLVELPMTTVRIGGVNLPFSGGGYLRLLPLAAYRTLRRWAHRQGVPVILYLHPWELDSYRPEVGLDRLSRVRSQGGQAGLAAKLERILTEGSFQTVGEYSARRLEAGDLPRMELPLAR